MVRCFCNENFVSEWIIWQLGDNPVPFKISITNLVEKSVNKISDYPAVMDSRAVAATLTRSDTTFVRTADRCPTRSRSFNFPS